MEGSSGCGIGHCSHGFEVVLQDTSRYIKIPETELGMKKHPETWDYKVLASTPEYKHFELVKALRNHQADTCWLIDVNIHPMTFPPIPIGSMYGIYGNIYHQYTPFMLAYIPAPWILWD